MATEKPGQYQASEITVLEGLDPVRKRPGMYIGSTGPRGLHHLVWEVVDNSVDEAMAGYCSRIDLTLQADGGVRVVDNGRGIPVDKHKATKESALTTVLTTLHAGGKFDSGAYQVSGGLHGVGVSVVNALSSRLVAEIRREGAIWQQTFELGVPQGPVKKIGEAKKTGTTITFWPSTLTFTETTEFDFPTIVSRLREMAFLNKGLEIRLTDERGEEEAVRETFLYKQGLIDFVKHINKNREPIHGRILQFEDSADEHELDIACNGPVDTPKPCSRLPTTSTLMRVARTKRDSVRRSREPSTSSLEEKAYSRKKTTTSPVRT